MQTIYRVCLADYQIHETCTAVPPGDGRKYPVVTHMLQEEAFDRLGVLDHGFEDLGLREEFESDGGGWALYRDARRKTWHSCF